MVVNATGGRAAQTCAMAGINISVEARKRYTYVFEAERPLGIDLPLTVDLSGVHVRTDGVYYMAGSPPEEDGPVDVIDFIVDHGLWENKFWPAIATRIPQFEVIRVINSWVGHYAYNAFDQTRLWVPMVKCVTSFSPIDFLVMGFNKPRSWTWIGRVNSVWRIPFS